MFAVSKGGELMNYSVSKIYDSDKKTQSLIDKLLIKEGIRRDKNLEYMAGVFDREYNLIAVGGFFKNTLRCLAVDSQYQGEGLMALIVTHLTEVQLSRQNRNLFLYTKCENADIFSALGFYEVSRVSGMAILMENRKNGFSNFLSKLEESRSTGKVAAIIVNCDPFTLGHRHLIERASKDNDTLHLFVVSEDASFFPFVDRYQLVKEGTADLKNVVLHETGNYMISSAVFPSYFLKDDQMAIEVQTKLDIEIFKRVAKTLGIQKRYVGEEPTSVVTSIYNQTMSKELQTIGVEHIVIPRKEEEGVFISASRVRLMLQEGRITEAKKFLPETTYNYLFTEAGQRVIKKIQNSNNVVHY